MISFDNTETAFKAKDNFDLTRSYWLFKMISKPLLVKLGANLAPVALSIGLKGLFKATIYKQFVGGESIDDCEKTISSLANFGIGTILDYSSEGQQNEENFDLCCNEIVKTIQKAQVNKNVSFCVFKVTGLARFELLEKVSSNEALTPEEKEELQRVKNRIGKICGIAYNAKQPIFIDAEESWIQPAIDSIANENMLLFNKETAIVYNTYQLYRKDRLTYLSDSIEEAKKNNYYIGAKLVRGAYMEKERARAFDMGYKSPIQETKNDTDRDYDAALELCVKNFDTVSLCAGTHNEQSSLFLTELMERYGISHTDKKIFFSQLFGMSDHISYNLASEKFNVVKYVPYGPVKEVMPYLIRRAQENTSVEGQTGRELSLIIKEKERRQKNK